MRQRMRKELDRSDQDHFDLKHGRGGIGDIEFLVQYLVLDEAQRLEPGIAQPRRELVVGEREPLHRAGHHRHDAVGGTASSRVNIYCPATSSSAARQPVPATSAQGETPSGIYAGPAVRKLAREFGVPLRSGNVARS